MKNLFVSSFLAIMLAQSCSGHLNSNKSLSNYDTINLSQKLDSYINEYIKLDIFSGVVLVAIDGNIIYHKPFGLANRENKTANTLNTKFLIGSMNKSFTQVVMLQLIDEGKIKLSDKLTQHISGFTQPMAKNITIEHLLNHRSGFGDYHNPKYWKLPYEQKNIRGITELLKSTELHFAPGSQEEYSNAGYILLGAIIEKVTAKSFSENVDQRIVQKLNLRQTYTKNIKNIPDKSVGYSKTIFGYENNLDLITEPRSDGGFWATAFDVLTFYRNFFYGETLLTQNMKAQMDYFNQIKNVPAGNAIAVAGGMNGINTVHAELLNEKISIVVMANMDEPVAEKIARGIKEILFSKTPEQPKLPAALNVYQSYKEKGVDYIKNNFNELTSNFHPSDPKDFILNSLGYQLLMSGKKAEAIEIFKLNTELFPAIANCWDSYGEALVSVGEKEQALLAYKKALSIKPDMESAKNALKELKKK